MFEYANSLNRRRRPTRRVFTSWGASILIHILLLFSLVQFPQLLRGGMYHRFRPLSILANIVEPKNDPADDNWRTVAVLRSPMTAPSAATLKKFMYDWKKGSEPAPVTVPLGKEQKAALEGAPRMPKLPPAPTQPKTLPPPNENAGTGTAGTGPAPAGPAGGFPDPTVDVRTERGGEKKGPPELPAEPAGGSDMANRAPSSIPHGISTPKTPKEPVKIFENEQKAIQSSQSGFFDTKGFPLDEYAEAVKERIRGNWYIPSNLRNSQGHTTIVFYIGKDGRYTNARIEPSASSGNTSLDLAALKAIMDSDPFPPLPNGFPGERIGAKFVLSYNEP